VDPKRGKKSRNPEKTPQGTVRSGSKAFNRPGRREQKAKIQSENQHDLSPWGGLAVRVWKGTGKKYRDEVREKDIRRVKGKLREAQNARKISSPYAKPTRCEKKASEKKNFAGGGPARKSAKLRDFG